MLKKMVSIVMCVLLIAQLCACSQIKNQPEDVNQATENITETKNDDKLSDNNEVVDETNTSDGKDDDKISSDDNAKVDEQEKLDYVEVKKCKVFVIDDADLLSEEETNDMLASLDKLFEGVTCNVMFYTYDEATEYTTKQVVDNYMSNELPQNEAGCVCFTINMYSKEIYIGTIGEASNLLDGGQINAAIATGLHYVGNADYAGCLREMAEVCLQRLN